VAAVAHAGHAGAAATGGTAPRVAHAHLHNEAVVEGAHVHETPHAHEPPATMLLPLWVLALMTMAGRHLYDGRRRRDGGVLRRCGNTPPPMRSRRCLQAG
jgi:hypothetical protein